MKTPSQPLFEVPFTTSKSLSGEGHRHDFLIENLEATPKKPNQPKAPHKPKPVPTFTADSDKVNLVEPASLKCGVALDKQNKPIVRPSHAITQVVIHTMVGHFQPTVDSWKNCPGTGQCCFKAHYAVRSDGFIVQAVPEKLIAHHANNANGNSIGIEHDGFPTDPGFYTEKMYVASAALTRNICQRYNLLIDRQTIIGHGEVCGANHFDPGGYWDWDYYLALVQWDGTPGKKPIRIIVDSTSPDFRFNPKNWTRATRLPMNPPDKKASVVPTLRHSWGKTFVEAQPETTSFNDRAMFSAKVPEGGIYELSLWWPLPNSDKRPNNPETVITVLVGDNPPKLRNGILLNLNSQKGRTGKTTSTCTPNWLSMGNLQLKKDDTVHVVVWRFSKQTGFVVADAMRLLRRSDTQQTACS